MFTSTTLHWNGNIVQVDRWDDSVVQQKIQLHYACINLLKDVISHCTQPMRDANLESESALNTVPALVAIQQWQRRSEDKKTLFLPSRKSYGVIVVFLRTMTAIKRPHWITHNTCVHDDVMAWKLFPYDWPFVWEIRRSSMDSPHKGSIIRNFDISFCFA